MSGEPYPLRLITPTDDFEINLRRYSPYQEGRPWHSVSVVIGKEHRPGYPYNGDGRDPTPEEREDPRWPTEHEGYTFVDTDAWQRNSERLWTLDGSGRFTLDTAPIGACYEAPREWHHAYTAICREYRAVQHERGTYWVKLPNGHWFSADRIAGNGDGESGWVTTGTLPLITVSPSISNAPGDPTGYHGWLGVNGTPVGQLSRDLDGRDC
ncbi:hypothetical protein [Deinococcus rufus]|uniref:Uncharacterized protein n=1 Tax=Deinococcus rufus TaxID=2136097 RepID=A0ABV7ZBC5_9DEIO